MIAFLLIVYVLAVWLIFVRFKLLKFDLKAKIGAGVGGVLFVFGLLISLNFLHPMTMDARVYGHVIEIAPRLPQSGRVVEVAVSPNVAVKKGELLFRIDPQPFQLEVDRLTAAALEAEQSIPQLKAAFDQSKGAVAKAQAQFNDAKSNFDRTKDLLAKKSIAQQEVDTTQRTFEASAATRQMADAAEEQARIAIDLGKQKLAGTQAQLAKAKLDLAETSVYAPADGFVTNLALEPGFIVAPGQAVLSFVIAPEGIVVATFPQEYLGTIEPGNAVEVALDMYPGRMLAGKVESVIWASGQGQMTPTGVLPFEDKAEPRGRFAVKIVLDPAVRERYRLPVGAAGAAAVYTDYVPSFRIVRKIVVRWYTWLNFVKISM